jgi:aspartate-semialdehyde dehydrogenase
LAEAPGVTVVDDRAANRFPMPRDADGKDDVFVGRIRRDMHNSMALNLFMCGDQIRKGAALNSIQIAERMREVVGA